MVLYLLQSIRKSQLIKAVESIKSEYMEGTFGNHVAVTYRDGDFEIEEYEHD